MKKEKMPSRKRRALGRVLIALAALFLVNNMFHTGFLFPIQAIRENEEVMGTGRTAVVSRYWAPEIHKSHLLYLTDREDFAMLSGAYLTPLGWMGAFGVPLDCAGEAPLYGGFWSMSRENREGSLFYVFGRVDDPEIARVKVEAQFEDWENGTADRWTAFDWDIPREDWLEKDGRYYFLCRKYPMNWSKYSSPVFPVVTGYNEAGNEIVRVELDQGASSHFS